MNFQDMFVSGGIWVINLLETICLVPLQFFFFNVIVELDEFLLFCCHMLISKWLIHWSD